MTWTTRNLAVTATLALTLQAAAPLVFAAVEDPNLVCERHPPGLFGPLQLTVDYSEKLGFFIDPKYINNIGPFDALSLEFGFGKREFRGAFTWGHALSERHFVKTSIEYFAQETNLDFLAGRDAKWVGEKGIGLDYQYNPIDFVGIHSFHLGMNYTSTENETLDAVTLPAAQGINCRRLAGGRVIGFTAGFTFWPWQGGEVSIDLHHDSVKFNKKNIRKESLVGPGATVSFHQLIGDRMHLGIEATDRQPYYEYKINATSIVPSAPGSRIELKCEYRTNGGPGVQLQRDNRYSFGIFYSWGGNTYGPEESYKPSVEPDMTTSLVEYTDKPAVRPPQVIVKIDERVK